MPVPAGSVPKRRLHAPASTGGQIYRQTPDRFSYASGARHTPEFHRGRELVAEATDAGVRFEIGSTAWGQFEPGVIEVVANGKPERIRAKRLVIATGAYDRPVPMPGWTLPGVFTVGGAQGLLKSQRILAGRRVLLGGLGPLVPLDSLATFSPPHPPE